MEVFVESFTPEKLPDEREKLTNFVTLAEISDVCRAEEKHEFYFPPYARSINQDNVFDFVLRQIQSTSSTPQESININKRFFPFS